MRALMMAVLLSRPALVFGQALELDPGGVSFPWPPAGVFCLEHQPVSDNVIGGGEAKAAWEQLRELGWSEGGWSGGSAAEPLPGTSRNEVLDGIGRDGSRGFQVTIEADAHRSISSYFSVSVPIEDVRGLRVSLWCRGGEPAPPAGSASVHAYPLRGEGWNMVGDSAERFFPARPGEWRQVSHDFVTPEGTERLYVQIKQRGAGQLVFDDVRCVRIHPDPDIHLQHMVTGPLDGVLALSAGDLYVGRIWLYSETGRRVPNAVLDLDLPEGIEFVPANESIASRYSTGRAEREGCRRHSVKVSWDGRFERQGAYVTMREILCLRTEAEPTGEDLPAQMRLRGDDYAGPWCDFEVRVLPRTEAVTPPRRLLVGGTLHSELEGEAARRFMDTYLRWGANMIAVRRAPTADLAALLRGSDLYKLLSVWTWRDASRVMSFHSGGEVPQEALWIGADGEPIMGSWLVCPEYVASRGGRFVGKVVPELRRWLVEEPIFDAWITNWEPQIFYSRGCFCPRCRAAFSQFVGEPEAKIMAMDAGELRNTYKERWSEFRASQSERLVRLAWAILEELSAERGQQIPCLLWCGGHMLAKEGGRDGMPPSLPQARALASWAYAGWRIDDGKWGASDPFYGETGELYAPELSHQHVASVAEEMTRRLAERTGGREAKYLHAVMGNFGSYVTTPEEQQLDILAAALARPWAICPFDFPEAQDHRYAVGFAQSMQLLAAHEDMILDGRKGDAKVVPLSAHHRDRGSMGGLWARSFRRDGKMLYCLLNFSREKEAFFRLELASQSSAQLVLWDPVQRRCYSSSDGPRLTVHDLAEGVFLHLGAARAAFLLLEPLDANADYGEHVDCREVRAAFEARAE